MKEIEKGYRAGILDRKEELDLLLALLPPLDTTPPAG